MADKQPLNATFYAFRKREKKGVLTTTTIAYVLLCLITFGLFGFLNWAAVVDYFNWISAMQTNAGSGAADPMAALTPPASIMALGPMYFLFQIVFYVIAAAYEAACLRWLVRGETGGVFGFSFGADTWRVYFTYWIWFFLGIVFTIVVFVVGGGVVGSMFAFSSGDADPSNLGAMGGVMALVTLVVLLAVIYLAVRLAPAAATSIAAKRFAFFDAWKVTKGRFWALLGAFVLLWVMGIVGYLILSTIAAMALVAGIGSQAGAFQEAQAPDAMLQALLQPQVLIPVVLGYGLMIIGAFVFMVATFGINARAAALALEEGKISAAS